MAVNVIANKYNKNYIYGLELTVVDYAWWVEQFNYNKVRFIDVPADIKHNIH